MIQLMTETEALELLSHRLSSEIMQYTMGIGDIRRAIHQYSDPKYIIDMYNNAIQINKNQLARIVARQQEIADEVKASLIISIKDVEEYINNIFSLSDVELKSIMSNKELIKDIIQTMDDRLSILGWDEVLIEILNEKVTGFDKQ